MDIPRAIIVWVLASLGSQVAIAADDWVFAHIDSLVGPSRLSQNPVDASIVPLAKDRLGLGDEQLASLESLRHACEAAWVERIVLAMEGRYDRTRLSRWNEDWEAIEERENEDLCRALEATRQQFFSDAQLLLSPDQQDRWAAFDREVVRVSTLAQYATYELEQIDLVSLLAPFDLDDAARARIRPILEEYALALDPLLRERNRIAAELGPKAMVLDKAVRAADQEKYMAPDENREALHVPAAEMESVATLAMSQLSRSDRIRELTRETAAKLCEIVPAPVAEEIRETVARCDQPPTSRPRAGINGAQVDRAFGLLETAVPAPIPRSSFDDNPSWLSDHSVVRWIRAEPLTPDQFAKLRVIRKEYLAERDRIAEQYPGAMSLGYVGGYRWLRTPTCAVMIQSESDKKALSREDQDQARELLAHLERQTILRMRDVLTIRQRALIVAW